MPGRWSNLLSLVAPTFWRQKIAAWRARLFDARHGLETNVVVPVSELRDVAENLARHAVHYEPSTLPKFERAMRAVAIDHKRFTFVDYGSGKGRVLLLAARYPFRKVMGVEMSRALHEQAGANIDAWLRRARLVAPIERICGDARDLPVPDGDLVAYFYNPFDELVLREVWSRLSAATAGTTRAMVVMYINPAHRKVFDEAKDLHCVYDDSAVLVYRSRESER